LQKFLQGGRAYIQALRTSSNLSRVPIARDYVNQAVAYSEKDQQAAYLRGGGVAKLGDFCTAGVCREKAALLHTLLADMGKESQYVVGQLRGGRHAWVEYVDTVSGIRMVADPTMRNMSIHTMSEYYNSLGVIVDKVQRYTFVKP
jgi:hypothetical protein